MNSGTWMGFAIGMIAGTVLTCIIFILFDVNCG